MRPYFAIPALALLPTMVMAQQDNDLPKYLAQKKYVNWAGFESHPARSFFDKAQVVTKLTVELLIYGWGGYKGDTSPWRFFNKFPEWNGKNEFEQHRLIPSLTQRTETRITELLGQEYFLSIQQEVRIGVESSLGQYDFTQNAFPYWTTSSGGLRKHEPKVGELVTFTNFFDYNCFPLFFPVPPEKAEKIAKNNPRRKITRYVVFKPTGYELHLVQDELIGEALFVIFVLTESGEILGITSKSPDETPSTSASQQLADENSKPPEENVEADVNPNILQRPSSEYLKSISQKLRMEGQVWIKVWVDKNGNPREVVSVRATNDDFIPYALEAGRKFLFTPAQKDNKPVAVWVVIPLRFR